MTRTPAAIVSALHDEIVEGRLAPGQLLTEGEVAERFGVSKTPAREALRQLASSYGYVVALAGRGYQITQITLREIHDVYDLLLRLAPGAAADAAGRDTARLEGLERCAVHSHSGDRESYVAMQRDHAVLVGLVGYLAGSAILGETLLRLADRSLRILSWAEAELRRTEPREHDHSALLAALRDGDRGTARALVEEDLVATRDRVMAAVLELDVPTGPPLTLPVGPARTVTP